MKDLTDSTLNHATDIPYFEGDFWISTIEDLIKELDIEEEDRRKLEEFEALKPSDDGYFDDSIDSEEPTEVRQVKHCRFSILNFIIVRHQINVNRVVVRHIRRKILRRPPVNVE